MHSSSNGDSDNANEHIKQTSYHYHQMYKPQTSRRRSTTYPHNNTRQIKIQQKVFGVDQQTSSFSKYLIKSRIVTMMRKLNYLSIFYERILMLRSTE